MHEYLYTVVRLDLPKIQMTVQSAHAAIEAAKAFLIDNPVHPHLVMLGVVDLHSLEQTCAILDSRGILYKRFYEEDIGNQLTAIATQLLSGKQRKVFRHFQLLTGD